MNLKYNNLKIKIPSRCIFNLASFDILNGLGGGYGLALDTDSLLTISISDKEKIIAKKYQTIIKYYLEIMKHILDIKENFTINLTFDKRIKPHSGFASNMMVACSLIYGINKMYNDPLTKEECFSIIKENYKEEDCEHIITQSFYTGNSLYTIYSGGLVIVSKDKECYQKFIIDNKMKCVIIKTEAKKRITDELKLHKLALKSDKVFAKEREKIIFTILPLLIKKKDYTSLAYYTKFIQSNGAQKVFRDNIYSNMINIPRVLEQLEDNNLITGLTNSFDIFVFTSNLSFIEKLSKEEKFNYDIFKINNNGLKIIKDA